MGVFDNIMGTLFGGKQESTKPKDVTPTELKGLRGPFADVLKNFFGAEGGTADLSGVPTYGGPLTAPITPGEEDILSTFDVNDPLQSARRDVITQGIRGDFAGPNPLLGQYIEAAQRPTFQALEETLSRTLPGRFTQGGQFIQPGGSSAFDRAAAIASRGAAQEAGDIATKISFPAYLAGREGQQNYVKLGQEEVQTMIQNLQAKALPRLIADLGIERGLEEFKSRITNLLQALSIATNAPLQNVASKQSASTQSGAFPALFPKGFQP